MDNTELKHWGVKGQKWGVRRYQNKDGSLTPAGKKRYDRDIQENNAKKKDNRIIIDGPDAKRWVKEDISRSKKVVDSVSDMNKELKNIERNVPTRMTRKKMDLSNMSDKELRDQINRANLERQYKDIFAEPAKMSRGRDFVRSTLDTTGSVLAIGASALGIALAIKELKG
jgi:hypothetical protein